MRAFSVSAVVVIGLACVGCGLIDAAGGKHSSGTDNNPGSCSSVKKGGCSCTGGCKCDDVTLGDGCHCTASDCVISSQTPPGCGTRSDECTGTDCQCIAGDAISCTGQSCEIVEIARNVGVCSFVPPDDACTCLGGACSCSGGDSTCCLDTTACH